MSSSNVDKLKLYQKLYESFKKSHTNIKLRDVQKLVNEVWRNYKRQAKTDKELYTIVSNRIEEEFQAATNSKSTVVTFPSEATSTCKTVEDKKSFAQPSSGPTEWIEISIKTEVESQEEYENIENEEKQSRAKPSQEAMKKKIELLESNLNALYSARDTMPNNVEIEKQIIKVHGELKAAKQSLKRKIQNALSQKKHRDGMKRKLEDICRENPDIKKKLSLRDSVGHPSLEADQPLLLKTIADIASASLSDNSIAGDRGPTEAIRSGKTLNELTQELQRNGFNISRSATYLRLLPKISNSSEGRRHVSTVPVTLTRAQSDHHKSHIDHCFAQTSIHYLENLASILGPEQVFFISQDDKARVPIGVTAANKQAPLLMHMEYRVTLPDHDWVIAERHKLIPSVYAGIKISSSMLGQPQAVGDSGPTYIAIRSGKHSSSTANTHAQDFETLLGLEEFQTLAKSKSGHVKPVVIMTVVGGPDENPRYQKVIAFAIQHFKRHDLDALFIATNAPGRSVNNRVERRMAPLSRELGGLILPHDHFGSHLDEQGVTIDENLEKNNFEFAGNVLAEVWSSMKIDEYSVSAKYIGSAEPDLPDLPDIKWYSEHVRESQYLLQIVKCNNRDCCHPRSGLFKLLYNRFLPPPVKVKQTADDLILDDRGQFLTLPLSLSLRLNFSPKEFIHMPYDYFCPTLKSKLSSRTCKTCGLYHASVKSLNRHSKEIHKNINTQTESKVRPLRVAARRGNEFMCIVQTLDEYQDAEWLEDNDIDISKEHKNEQAHIKHQPSNVIEDLESWIQVAWTENA